MKTKSCCVCRGPFTPKKDAQTAEERQLCEECRAIVSVALKAKGKLV